MQLPWIERPFDFEVPVEMFPCAVERVRGTPARIEDKLRGLEVGALTRRDGERWSLQEHVGHLLDLDALHTGRLDDYLADASVLRAADMSNQATVDADHNTRAIEELLAVFRDERSAFVARLDDWDPARWGQSGRHERLGKDMRVIDLVWFVAEHDDHHLTTMTSLVVR